MNIEKELQKELGKIKCAKELTINTIKLNSDLGRKVIENVVKNLTIPCITQQRELLIDFSLWMCKLAGESDTEKVTKLVDTYLKSNSDD